MVIVEQSLNQGLGSLENFVAILKFRQDGQNCPFLSVIGYVVTKKMMAFPNIVRNFYSCAFLRKKTKQKYE